MVNEINKPSSVTDGPPALDNAQLGQRLASSSQALVEMQTEHQQLMQEMEQLRVRAEQLQSVREVQEEQHEIETHRVCERSVEQVSRSVAAEEVMHIRCTTTEEVIVEEVDEDENPEEAEYIRAKLAEIAKLKAQFNRVQNMISTTDMIEKHIGEQSPVAEIKQAAEAIRSATASSSMVKQASQEVVQQQQVSQTSSSSMIKQASQDIVQQQQISESIQSSSTSSVTQQASRQIVQKQESSETIQSSSSTSVTKEARHGVMQQQTAVSSSSSAIMESSVEQSISSSSSTTSGAITAGGSDEKQQLLESMIDMFQDLNSDLKTQAESLREERERIKALKEHIIASKKEQPQ
uniref:Uncharacterized protein n=1 Tax=Musca domestica TaxID=7370 RepID=A0A1I8N0S2_MUSDO